MKILVTDNLDYEDYSTFLQRFEDYGVEVIVQVSTERSHSFSVFTTSKDFAKALRSGGLWEKNMVGTDIFQLTFKVRGFTLAMQSLAGALGWEI